jgi:SHS2 domain-containing protein
MTGPFDKRGPFVSHIWKDCQYCAARTFSSDWCLLPASHGTITIMHETFEHTADLGLRVRAPDLDTLFIEAAMALFEAIVEDLGTVRPVQQVDVALEGDERDYLLFDWLKELLSHVDANNLLLGKFDVHMTDAGLKGTAWGEPLDRSRHALEHEVKAITYHGLRVEQTPDGWLAEIIVDI